MKGFIISDFECSTRLPARRRLGVYGTGGLPWASLSCEAFS